MYQSTHEKVTVDPRQTSDPLTADHHWHPFLRYEKKCKELGKEVTINEWMRSTGKLNDLIDFENTKAAAADAASKKTEKKG